MRKLLFTLIAAFVTSTAAVAQDEDARRVIAVQQSQIEVMKQELARMEQELQRLQGTLETKADRTHTHDFSAQFAAKSHSHDGVYAPLNHNHDAAYAPKNHNHDAAYAPKSHNHDASYAPKSHSHWHVHILNGGNPGNCNAYCSGIGQRCLAGFNGIVAQSANVSCSAAAVCVCAKI